MHLGRSATEKLLSLAPDGGRAWQLAGEQFRLQGNLQKALSLFQGAVERRPDLLELRKLITDLGGTAPAESSVPKAANDQEDELYQQAHREEELAQQAFQQVIRLAPDSHRAHQIMGNALTTQDRDVEAVGEYRAVLASKPDLPGIHELIGNCLLRSGKTKEALKEYQAELELQPRSAMANLNLGRALLLTGNSQAAKIALMRSQELDRPPPEVHKFLGKIDLANHDYKSAIQRLEWYTRIRKNDATAYYMLLRAYRAVKNADGMKRAEASYNRYSLDALGRSRAQGALDSWQRQSQVPEESSDQETPSAPR